MFEEMKMDTYLSLIFFFVLWSLSNINQLFAFENQNDTVSHLTNDDEFVTVLDRQ